MAIALTKPWRPLNEAEVAKLGGHMGVYELGNGDGEVVYVGFAGGKSRFGLKGELMRVLREEPARSTGKRTRRCLRRHQTPNGLGWHRGR